MMNHSANDNDTRLTSFMARIEAQLLQELQLKQQLLEEKSKELNEVRLHLAESRKANRTLQEQLLEQGQLIEGNRQLINKLLNDQSRLQQDVEWFRRTYETRTLVGLLKDRIKYFFTK
jgi:hypothetical protein